MEQPFGYGAAVYGSIVATGLVGAELEAGASARTVTLTLLATMLVLWLAHLWAEIVGERVEAGRRFRPRRVVELAAAEWAVVEAALLPTVLVALAWAGAWSRETGLVLAVVAGILQLFGWGVVVGRRSYGRWRLAVASGVVDAALGVGIVALEVGIHHL